MLALLSTAAGAEEAPVTPGRIFEVTAADLPAPYATDSVSNGAVTVARPGAVALRVPEGFKVNLFAEGLTHARWMTVAGNGDVLLAEPRHGSVTLLRDLDGDGAADEIRTFAEGFQGPHGLALAPGWLYVADVRAIWRLPYQPGDLRARGPAAAVTPPGALGQAGGHWTRNLALDPDGSRFFVTVGSLGNIEEEPPPHASVQVFRTDGSGQRTWADGLRNPVGIAFAPGGGLFTVVNERDGMGDELVPDFLARLEEGDFFGWPYAYSGANPQPGFADKRPDLVARSKTPEVLFRSHSAPIGLVFYDPRALRPLTPGVFPPDYHGDAFVALRGSWNAAEPRGYMVARVPFTDGRPTGAYEAFVTGFRINSASPAQVWGRPTGLALAPDGSLLIADDLGNTIWRVSRAAY